MEICDDAAGERISPEDERGRAIDDRQHLALPYCWRWRDVLAPQTELPADPCPDPELVVQGGFYL
ncbi:hypothetical protein D3C81_2284840 [compost metagenome]